MTCISVTELRLLLHCTTESWEGTQSGSSTRPAWAYSQSNGSRGQLLCSWHCPTSQCGITLRSIHPVVWQESQQIHCVIKARGVAEGHDFAVIKWHITFTCGLWSAHAFIVKFHCISVVLIKPVWISYQASGLTVRACSSSKLPL